MPKGSRLIAAMGLLVATVMLGAAPQTAEDIFQKALRLERSEGKLEEAIGLYQTILKQHRENRQVAAEAQFRIGLCYEQLGNREAQNAYQTVIQDYAEQKEAVAKAKDRLSKLARPSEKTEEPEGIRIKQVWKKPYLDSLGSVSPDGRFLAYIDWGEGDLAIHDLKTGENRILPRDANLTAGFAQEPLFSRNGKQIAYSWWNPYHTYDLFLVDVSDSKPRRIYRREGEHVYPATWLSDDELLFTSLNYGTRLFQVCSLSISSGAIRVLKSQHGRMGGGLSASPDGRLVAYSFGNEADKGNSDINLLAMDGSGETSLVKHPGDDKVLGWVPGRNEFLFTSDRSGTWDLWAVTIEGTKASGPARRIYTDIGAVGPVGFALNGDCFVGFSRRNFNALLAPFNPDTGELQERSGQDLLGSNYGIAWSPNGQYLSYIRMDRRADNPMQLTLRDARTGGERGLADHLYLVQAPCWSPDGNSILVIGGDRNRIGTATTKGYKGGIFRVDVPTGRTTEILDLSNYKYPTPDDDAFPLSDVRWSIDGQSIFYLFFTDRLVKRNLATGEEKTLYKHPRFERNVLDVSPDGRNLLFGVRSPEDKKGHLYTIPVDGGDIKELCTAQEANSFGVGMWSPDGKYAYFTEQKDGTGLWRIPAEGGIPQKVWHSKDRAEVFSIHPDGKQLALAIYVPELEIRVIKNLAQELEKQDKTAK